ncbi:chymotrypsin-2-like [Oppia nitens]|uniref:chymotrypsin-2-like n=1 Tax=Oppia nitens TaxID=1686743 RepID=UPI0023DBF80C|nr:chymotrypsin-2-like [Oppia nitens]
MIKADRDPMDRDVNRINNTDDYYDYHHRLIGGIQTHINYHKYVVSIRTASNNRIICGGVIIDKQWILTSGQCVVGYRRNPNSLTVWSGTDQLSSGGENQTVDKIIFTDGADLDKLRNHVETITYNIALIKLKLAINLNGQTIKSVKLTESRPVFGHYIKLLGWGSVNQSNSVQNKLTAGDMYYDNNARKWCMDNYPVQQFCLYNRVYGVGTYDHGGPALYHNPRVSLVGIISTGFTKQIKPIQEDRPSVTAYYAILTDITEHRDWILKKTGI